MLASLRDVYTLPKGLEWRGVSEVRTKYGAIKTWSGLTRQWHDSKAEAARGEELWLLQKAGKITDLEYHRKYTLSQSPKVVIEVDFVYKQNGQQVYEDFKGKEPREYRVKRIWAKEKFGIDILLTK